RGRSHVGHGGGSGPSPNEAVDSIATSTRTLAAMSSAFRMYELLCLGFEFRDSSIVTAMFSEDVVLGGLKAGSSRPQRFEMWASWAEREERIPVLAHSNKPARTKHPCSQARHLVVICAGATT